MQKQLNTIQIENLEKKEQLILVADSVFTVKYNQKIQSTDSIYRILAKKDSLLDKKNKLQDEAIRNIIIPSNLLPKL